MDWTLETINELLSKQAEWTVSVESDCLLITNDEEIEVFLTLCGEQIIAESLLASVSQVKNSAAFNDEILRTHKLFPLTTMGIVTINSVEYYAAFGALSSQSKSESIVLEVDFLFQNVVGMLDAYEKFI